MDRQPAIPARDDEQRVICEMIGRFDAPAFIRRAKRVEESYRALLARLESERSDKLKMVCLTLGQLHALAGAWPALVPLLTAEDIARLIALHNRLQPRLRMPLEPTRSARVLRLAIAELREAMERFNRRWQEVLDQLDLAPLNAERDGYNRYYLLEKECALGSARAARASFRPLQPMTRDHLWELFPLLEVPEEPRTK